MPNPNLMPFAYFRKEIIPAHEASVSIASHSLQYGTTCFGGIKGYFQDQSILIFRLEEHFTRLQNSAKILGMEISLNWEDFHSIIRALVESNRPQGDIYLRPFIFCEHPYITPRFDGLEFDLAIYLMPLKHYFDSQQGLRLMVSSWRKISDSMVSTKAKAGGCYVNSALATTEAKRCGYDEALMMDEHGYIVEASVANIFVVYRGEVIMPETGSSMLEGVTRRSVIEFLEEERIPIRSEKIDRSMIYTCDELILTGTAAQIMHGQSVDGRCIGSGSHPGPICQLLRNKLSQVIRKEHPKSTQWIKEFKIKESFYD